MAKTYTTVADKGVRDQFTEAMWDTMLRDNLNNIMSPAMCRIHKSVLQTITTATETSLSFDIDTIDTDSMHDTVTNNSRVIPTTAGLYVVSGAAAWTSLGSVGMRSGYLKMNGTNYMVANSIAASASGNDVCVSDLLEFNGSTDYVEHRVIHSQGSNQDVGASATAVERRSHMAACWVGRTS